MKINELINTGTSTFPQTSPTDIPPYTPPTAEPNADIIARAGTCRMFITSQELDTVLSNSSEVAANTLTARSSATEPTIGSIVYDAAGTLGIIETVYGTPINAVTVVTFHSNIAANSEETTPQTSETELLENFEYMRNRINRRQFMSETDRRALEKMRDSSNILYVVMAGSAEEAEEITKGHNYYSLSATQITVAECSVLSAYIVAHGFVGKEIVFRKGTYTFGNVANVTNVTVFFRTTALVGNTIRAEFGEEVILKFRDNCTSASGRPSFIQIESSDVIVSGFILDGNKRNNLGMPKGILINNAPKARVENMVLYDIDTGFEMGVTSDTFIQNNYFHDCVTGVSSALVTTVKTKYQNNYFFGDEMKIGITAKGNNNEIIGNIFYKEEWAPTDISVKIANATGYKVIGNKFYGKTPIFEATATVITEENKPYFSPIYTPSE